MAALATTPWLAASVVMSIMLTLWVIASPKETAVARTRFELR